MTKKILVLGEKYTVYTGVPTSKDPALAGRFGYCCPTARKIVIADLDSIEGWKDETYYSKRVQENESLRHEIMHAFLYESGVWGSSMGTESWAMNEEMVDWIAIQFPKILKVYRELGCEGEV